MQLDELQSVRDRERQTDKLQQLRASFYADAGEFIQQLRAERDRAAERADDPFDAPEVNRLTDEINTAEQTVEAIYEKRVGKIVKAASFAAADLPAEADGMTDEEQALFDQLVGDIKQNREHVLDVLAGEGPPGADVQAGEEDASATDTDASAGDRTPPTAAADSSQPSQAQSADDGPSPQPGDAGQGHPTEDAPSPAQEATTPESDQDEGVAAADLMGGGSDTASGGEREVPPPPEADEEKLRNDGGGVSERPAPAATSSQSSADETPAATPADGTPARQTADTSAEQVSPSAESAAVERTTVRVTDDVDTFVGSDDRDYDLERDDVVTLPAANAELLIDSDAAEQL